MHGKVLPALPATVSAAKLMLAVGAGRRRAQRPSNTALLPPGVLLTMDNSRRRSMSTSLT